ncbi:MAG: hypothetical protein LRY71_09555 [Bacillaceae bacterium]|nr:hypothetical protein [Bacillaceae bacterium]
MDELNELENEGYEPSPEDFIDHEEDLKEIQKQKVRKEKRMKRLAMVITAVLLFQVFAVFFFNIYVGCNKVSTNFLSTFAIRRSSIL